MDLCGCLTKMSDFNFYMNYGKELKENHDQAELLLDAWMAISGKQHPEFDLQIFKQNNPYVSEKVGEIRAKSGLRICWIDREEKARHILN